MSQLFVFETYTAEAERQNKVRQDGERERNSKGAIMVVIERMSPHSVNNKYKVSPPSLSWGLPSAPSILIQLNRILT